MIKVANIVRENSRRRSGSETINFDAVISNPPVSEIASSNDTSTNATETDPVQQEAFNNVTAAADALINSIASGNFSLEAAFENVTSLDETVVATLPSTPAAGHEPVSQDTTQETTGELFSDLQQAADAEILASETTPVVVAVPTSIEIIDSISINQITLEEMVSFPLSVPLKISLMDQDNNLVENTGTSSPWEVTAALLTNSAGATLQGSTVAEVVDGYAEFSDIYVDKTGEGYEIEFSVTTPDVNAVNNTVVLSIPKVNLRPISVKFTSMPVLEKIGVTFSQDVVVSLWDDATNAKADVGSITNISAIAPSDTSCELTLLTAGELGGTLTATIDASKFSH